MSDIHDDDVSGYLIDKLGMKTARDILEGKSIVVPNVRLSTLKIVHGSGEPVKTLLDEFAMAALTGEIASFSTEESCRATAEEAYENNRTVEQQIAFSSYDAAEAMMAEKLRRERGK